jgi:HPt (histidine-containing phosphotransfer) domain-containing protein
MMSLLEPAIPRAAAEDRKRNMARRDIKGVVDFGYLEDFAAGDAAVIDEVLELFREQAAVWARLLDPGVDSWRDAVHTIKGAARGVGAFALGEACAWAEAKGVKALPSVRDALDSALADIAAYAHERALNSLKRPKSGDS